MMTISLDKPAESVARGTSVAVTVQGWQLRYALQTALVAVGTDTTLPGLCQVRVEVSGRELTVAATDRYRLAVGRVQLDSDACDGMAFGISSVDAKALVRDLPKKLVRVTAPCPVTVTAPTASGGWSAQWDGRTVSGRDSEDFGTFPKWRGLFPDPVDDAPLGGIAFNPAFVGDIGKLPTFDRMPVVVRGTEPTKPVVWSYGNREDGFCWDYLLMPVRLSAAYSTAVR